MTNKKFRLMYQECCYTASDSYNSLEELVLDGEDWGKVAIDTLEECGHWTYAEHATYNIYTIELYELANYLKDWGVDTLDSDRFIVYTHGEHEPFMLKILEAYDNRTERN